MTVSSPTPSFAWLGDLGDDVRYTFRALRRSAGFTLVAIVTLALGIGVNVAVFTVMNAVLFKGFRTVEANDRIVYIGAQRNGRGCCASYPDFVDWRAQASSFEDMGAVADLPITFRDQGLLETYGATRISVNTFRLLGQSPIIGRDFAGPDERPGAEPAAILSYGFWESRYARDPTVVGRNVSINGVPTTIVGVMPQGFAFPQNQALWVPLVPTPALLARDVRTLWFAFGRMRPGVTTERAAAELQTIGARLAREYPGTNEGWVPSPRTFSEFFVGPNARVTYGSLWGAVALMLLIVCANLANLMLARALGRSRETSLRLALGAGSWRIVRQLLVESTMLSAIAGVLGWWIAKWAVRAYEVTANPPTRAWSSQLVDYTMDTRAVAYVIAVAAGTGLLFGLAPALRVMRFDINAALKSGSRTAAAGHGRLSALLVIGEVTLAMVLLSGAGVMIRSFLKIYSADIGVDTKNLVTMFVSLPRDRYPDSATRSAFYDHLFERLGAVPGVDAIAAANTIPAGGTGQLTYDTDSGSTSDPRGTPVPTVTVSPRYFAALGATVLAGREFTAFDDDDSVAVAVVNQQFAKTFWPGQDAVGKRLRIVDRNANRPLLTVVGVVSNIRQDVPRQRVDPLVYVSYRQRPIADMWLIFRTQVGPGRLATPFRQALAAVDPNLPIGMGPFRVDERLAGMGNYWTMANNTVILLICAAIALLLASVGLYAVVAHAVSQHTQEIGIRLAVGARTRDVLTMVMRQGMIPLGIGLLIGLAASLGFNRLLTSQLVNVSPTDPATLLLSSAVLLVAATAGCLIPARRATRVDPSEVLRA